MQCECSILSSVASPALHYVSTILINGTIFEKIVEHRMCGLIFPTSSFRNASFLEELGEILSKMYIGRHVK
jgi:hypothetical protein